MLKMSDKEVKKNLRMINKGIDYLINHVFRMSMYFYIQTATAMTKYREEHKIDKDVMIESAIAKEIVDKEFTEELPFLEMRSIDIAKACVRQIGIFSSCVAWIFCKEHLHKNDNKIKDVPVLWEYIDMYFKQFNGGQDIEIIKPKEIIIEDIIKKEDDATIEEKTKGIE